MRTLISATVGRLAAVVLPAAVLAGASLATAAAPAGAAGPQCRVGIISVTAFELQEPNQDEIWVYLNNKFFPTNQKSITFTEGQTRTFNELNEPAIQVPLGSVVTVGLLEDDTWPNPNDPLGEFDVSCGEVQPSGNIGGQEAGYQYDILFSASVVP